MVQLVLWLFLFASCASCALAHPVKSEGYTDFASCRFNVVEAKRKGSLVTVVKVECETEESLEKIRTSLDKTRFETEINFNLKNAPHFENYTYGCQKNLPTLKTFTKPVYR